MKPERLYFVVRADLSEGRRAAQLIHAMDDWAATHGPQQGTVIVYEVPTEEDLLLVWGHVEGARRILFRESDFGGAATAMATDFGPMDLPLLGSLAGAKASWPHKARRRAGVMRAVMRPVEDRPSPPTEYA